MTGSVFLIHRINDAKCGRIYNHWDGILTVPDGVTRTGIMQLDSEMMDDLGELFEIDENIPCLTPGTEI